MDHNTPHTSHLKRTPRKGMEPQGHRAGDTDTGLKPSTGVATPHPPALRGKERDRDAGVCSQLLRPSSADPRPVDTFPGCFTSVRLLQLRFWASLCLGPLASVGVTRGAGRHRAAGAAGAAVSPPDGFTLEALSARKAALRQNGLPFDSLASHTSKRLRGLCQCGHSEMQSVGEQGFFKHSLEGEILAWVLLRGRAKWSRLEQNQLQTQPQRESNDTKLVEGAGRANPEEHSDCKGRTTHSHSVFSLWSWAGKYCHQPTRQMGNRGHPGGLGIGIAGSQNPPSSFSARYLRSALSWATVAFRPLDGPQRSEPPCTAQRTSAHGLAGAKPQVPAHPSHDITKTTSGGYYAAASCPGLTRRHPLTGPRGRLPLVQKLTMAPGGLRLWSPPK